MRPLTLPLALFALTTQAHAQDRPDASRTVDELTECRATSDDAQRLACFDRIADRIVAARKSGQLLVLDRELVVERKRRAFGLANPSADVFGGGAEDEATRVTELDTTVQGATPTANPGRWNIQLANGMVWQSVDPLSFPPKAGAPIKLKNALLGGYRASINGGRTFLVKRLR
jgi:hypothetical protein